MYASLGLNELTHSLWRIKILKGVSTINLKNLSIENATRYAPRGFIVNWLSEA